MFLFLVSKRRQNGSPAFQRRDIRRDYFLECREVRPKSRRTEAPPTLNEAIWQSRERQRAVILAAKAKAKARGSPLSHPSRTDLPCPVGSIYLRRAEATRWTVVHL